MIEANVENNIYPGPSSSHYKSSNIVSLANRIRYNKLHDILNVLLLHSSLFVYVSRRPQVILKITLSILLKYYILFTFLISTSYTNY